MKKRLLATLLVLCMVLSLLPGTAAAEPNDAIAEKIREDAENIIWGAEHPVEIACSTYLGMGGSYCTAPDRVRLDLTTVVLGIPDESWSGAAETPTSLNIPAQVDGLSVTDLGAVDIFYEASNLFHFAKVETVTVPEGVKYLHSSFTDVPSLKAVVLPTSLIYIGRNAFASCTALASINFPNNLAYIAEDAFSGCVSLQSIAFPESLLYIGPGAFSDCAALQTVTIPKNVGQIESGAFMDCPNLTIYCYTNSCAHQYAVEHNIPFVLLDDELEQPGIAQILGLSPQPGAEDVSYDSENPPVFQIIFDRPIASIEAAVGTFSIYRASDDELLYSSSTAADFQFSGATLTVAPDIQLESATEYYITLESETLRFEDDAINPAIVKGRWDFVTEYFSTVAGVRMSNYGSPKTTVIATAWRDDWFTQTATIYNHDLATTAAVLSGSVYVDDAGGNPGSGSIESALQNFGFEHITPINYYSQSYNTVAFCLAVKTISNFKSGPQHLISVIIKGTDPTNINDLITDLVVGSETEHIGFRGASNDLWLYLSKYRDALIERGYQLNTVNTSFFITGHSLGGAVANFVARDITNSRWTDKNAYAYTFASPTVSKSARTSGYENIFNIVNPDDLFPKLPFSECGYSRYGIDLRLPSKSDYSVGFDALYEKMNFRTCIHKAGMVW